MSKILNQFLTKLLMDEAPKENLIRKIFIKRYDDIIKAEKKGEVNNIMRSEIKPLLSGKEEIIDADKEELDNILTQTNNYNVIKNIKFKKIDIEGIKGIPSKPFCSEKEELCSSDNTYLNISSDKKIISLFGFNGEGKSSFTESLEYCLLGQVREAKRRNYTKNDVQDYIKNVNSDFGKISVLFKENFQGKELKIMRDTSGSFKIEKNDFNIDNVAVKEFLIKELNKIFIEKNRIDEFVLSKGKTRTNLYGELLGFSEINDFIRVYWNSYETEKNNKLYDKQNENIKKYKKTIKNKADKPKLNLSDEEKKILNNKVMPSKKVNRNNFTDIEDFDRFKEQKKERLTKIFNERKRLEKANKTKELIKKIKGQNEEVKGKEKDLKSFTTEKETEEMFFDMYESANALLEKDKYDDCPLCGDSKKSIDEIENKIKSYLSDYKEIKCKKKSIKEAKESLRKLKIKLENDAKDLFETPEIDIDYDDLDSLIESVEELESKLSYEEKEKYIKEEKIIEELSKKINKYHEKFISYKKQDKMIEKTKQKKIQEEEYNRKVKRVLNEIEEFESAMEDHRIELVNETLKNIADLIKKYYNMIVVDNKINYLSFEAKSSDIEIDSKFDNYEDKINPELILSEGQLKCFGTSILLALHENAGLKPMILDDIINAVDIDHRQNMIDLIINEFDDKQIFITTYDKLFREKLINKSDENEALSFSFNNSLLCKQKNNYFKIIEKAIENRNCRQALLYMRVLLENSAYSIAENNNLKISFKDRIKDYKLSKIIDEIIGSDELFAPIIEILKEIRNDHYDLLNQEAHFWTEKALTIDHNTLNYLFEQIKAIKRMTNFKKSYLAPIKKFKEEGKPDVELLSINKSINILSKNNSGSEHKTTQVWDDIVDFIE